MTGRPLTGKPTTRPDHLGPRAWATDVTASTVSAETTTRIVRSDTEVGPRRSVAESGRRRTRKAAPRHTAAANGIAVSGPSGSALRARVATTKVAVPSDTPAVTDHTRGDGTRRVAIR